MPVQNEILITIVNLQSSQCKLGCQNSISTSNKIVWPPMNIGNHMFLLQCHRFYKKIELKIWSMQSMLSAFHLGRTSCIYPFPLLLYAWKWSPR
jgi:hypothetical protein